MKSFPTPKLLKIDKKGTIHLTDEQWIWLAEYLHAKNHSLKYQRAAIKAFICGCLDMYVKNLDIEQKRR